MKKDTRKNLTQASLEITQQLQKSGFEAFWVGGAVRDLLLGQKSDNIDIATSAKPAQVEKILDKLKYHHETVNKKFGTILAITKSGPIEITTFRIDGVYENRRKPKKVEFISDYTKDSQRRDFTVNAIYYNPVTKDVFDPQHGQKDLKGKILRFVGDPRKRIDEDALRMLRAVRLSVQLGFKLEKNTFAAIKTRAKYIQEISGERIKAELDKILGQPGRVDGIRLLDKLGILKFILPELEALKYVNHKSKFYHLEGSVFEHSLLALANLSQLDPLLGYCALYHDTGKANTATPKRKDEGLVNSFPAHEFFSAEHARQLAHRLKFSRHDRDKIMWISAMHMKRHAFSRDMSEKKKITLAMHKYFPLLLEIWRADSLSNKKIVGEESVQPAPLAYEQGLKMLRNIQKHQQLIEKISNGDFIMRVTKISAGKRIGEIKTDLATKIIQGQIKNFSDAEYFLKKIAKNP